MAVSSASIPRAIHRHDRSRRRRRHGHHQTKSPLKLLLISHVRYQSSACGYGKGKRSSWALVWLRPKPTLMTLDDGTTDGQPDSHPAALGRVERLEQPLHRLRIEPHPRILRGQPDPVTLV